MGNNKTRKQIGKESEKKGKLFENKVAELYRLLNYKVTHGRIFGGRQVDLFLETHHGDLTIHRAMECKSGQVTCDDFDNFLRKLDLVKMEYPKAQGTIVSGEKFTDAVNSHAAKIGIQATLLGELSASLLDGRSYAQALIMEIESNDNYPKEYYIEQYIGDNIDTESFPSKDYIDEWYNDSECNQLTLLGDLGTGKTFLTRIIAYEYAKKYLDDPLNNPLPVHIDLRNADREISLEGIVLTHFERAGIGRISFEIFKYSLIHGKIILILDGFDEMASRVTPIITQRNFQELVRYISGQAKVLLTCRTHYFRSRTDEEEVILGEHGDFENESFRELYWDLISRKGFKIAYLRPFTISQIEQYVNKVVPDRSSSVMAKMRKTYNLIELSQRPLLLDMIIKSIDKIQSDDVEISALYKVFTGAWIHREGWRGVITPEEKKKFLVNLSRVLWDKESSAIYYKDLFEYIQQESDQREDSYNNIVELDHEIRTATFLSRNNDRGHYGFAHKSFGEFFLAQYLAGEIVKGDTQCLNIKRVSPEVVSFMWGMLPYDKIENLIQVLQGDYVSRISENALIIYYGFLKERILRENSVADICIDLPVGMNMQNAKLEKVNLEYSRISDSDFSGSNLSGAIFQRIVIKNSYFRRSKLDKIDCHGSTFENSDFSNAVFDEALLYESTFCCSKFNHCSFIESNLLSTSIDSCDFTNASIQSNLISKNTFKQLSGKEFFDNVKTLLEPDDTSEEWKMILELLPDIRKISKNLVRQSPGYEEGDLESMIILRLFNSKVLETLKKIGSKDGRVGYIYTFSRNTFNQALRYRHREFQGLRDYQNSLEYDYEGFDNSDSYEMEDIVQDLRVDTPLVDIIKSEIWERVSELLDPLSLRIVIARFVDEHSVNEIAEKERISKYAVNKYIMKSKEILLGSL